MFSISQILQTNRAKSLSLDECLVFEAQQNSRAFKSLYERHYNEVFFFVQNNVSDGHTSANLTHQVFRKALSEIKNYRFSRITSYSKYLIGIARMKCGSFLRSRNKKNERLSEDLSTMPVDYTFSKDEIESLMDFEMLWKDPEIPETKIELTKNIFAELTSYIDAQVFRRAFISFGIIGILGLAINIFLADRASNNVVIDALDVKLKDMDTIQKGVVSIEDLACLDV